MSTAKLQWIDQSAFDLRLRVYAGPMDRNRLHVLREDVLESGRFHLWMAIIGSSHALCLRAGNRQISELCSCQDASSAALPPLRSVRLAERCHQEVVHSGRLQYRFASATHTWEDGLQRAEAVKAAAVDARGPGQTGLLYAFPTTGDYSPFTALLASAADGRVSIQTVHAYPNEGNIVLTTSTIVEA